MDTTGIGNLGFREVWTQNWPTMTAIICFIIAGKDWGRITGVIFSTHVATTMVGIDRPADGGF